ncbi:MAG: thymidylate synthase [Parcubacteria bacterium C7867-001]|nr:MAG: thymidylate synthase [Parcubacteria bacterium C7867-001]
MEYPYKPQGERTPDTQYRDRLRTILETGVRVADTPQGVGALTCFGTLSPMVFDLSNGVPLITERSIGFWRKPVAEIIAFMNGARTIPELEAFGCDFWGDYRGKGSELGLDADDLGPGSYGPGFHDFEIPGGGFLNQFAQVVDQIKTYPSIRTHLVSPWKPYYTARGPNRKVIVAPCHGWLHFRVIDGKLHMRMDQRSADMPIGVPSNMIQYAAVLLMVSQVTGIPPGTYIHSFADAHIYEDQVEKVQKLLEREPRPFPVMKLDPSITDLFAFRPEHFTIEEYDPHKGMLIPYRP